MLNGHGLTVDSFDSSNPTNNTGGLYDPTKRLAGGAVSTPNGFSNSRIIQIHGEVFTGPTATLALGTGGYVGDLNWTSGIEAGYAKNDLNQDYRPAQAPDITGFTPIMSGGGFKYAIPTSGGYILNGDLNLGPNDRMDVQGNVNAILYVAGNINMFTGTNAAAIKIEPGSSLSLYVAGSSANLANITMVSPTSVSGFQYFGLPSNTNVTWTSSSNYVGTIYAPDAEVTLGNASAHTHSDFQGACVANTLNLNGHFYWHFDQALTSSPAASRGFVVTSWREL
jgi:hypothetical protein